jgi:hypothetical protein
MFGKAPVITRTEKPAAMLRQDVCAWRGGEG